MAKTFTHFEGLWLVTLNSIAFGNSQRGLTCNIADEGSVKTSYFPLFQSAIRCHAIDIKPLCLCLTSAIRANRVII